jgi:hypothetical protein
MPAFDLDPVVPSFSRPGCVSEQSQRSASPPRRNPISEPLSSPYEEPAMVSGKKQGSRGALSDYVKDHQEYIRKAINLFLAEMLTTSAHNRSGGAQTAVQAWIAIVKEEHAKGGPKLCATNKVNALVCALLLVCLDV